MYASSSISRAGQSQFGLAGGTTCSASVHAAVKALVIGGTGPTGPYLVQGLLQRGYEVTIFHRGTHEVDELPPVEHIHGDPHFARTIADALRSRRFDLVIAAYGRIKLLADALAGRCEHFVSIGGVPIYRGFFEPDRVQPYGMAVPSTENAPLTDTTAERDSAAVRFSHLVYQTERHVLNLHDSGAFRGTSIRYPSIYGPRQVGAGLWSVIKRVLDGRPSLILPDGGLAIVARSAAANAAHAVLLATDKPEVAGGQVYNCVDDEQFTLRQWTEMIAGVMHATIEIVSLPDELSYPARPLFPLQGPSVHRLVDGSKSQRQLGYRDVISPLAALRESVAWFLNNPVTLEAQPGFSDRFDYEQEDRLIRAYRRAVAAINLEVEFQLADTFHPYPHPTEPGAARDHRSR